MNTRTWQQAMREVIGHRLGTCPRCGWPRTLHPLKVCPVTMAVLNALRTFKATHGRTWKVQLVRLWESGRPIDRELQEARNVIGPSRLYKVKV